MHLAIGDLTLRQGDYIKFHQCTTNAFYLIWHGKAPLDHGGLVEYDNHMITSSKIQFSGIP